MSRPIPVLRELPEVCAPILRFNNGNVDLIDAARRRAYAVRWRREGFTLSEIAKAMGVSACRVSQIIRKEGGL
jgi:Homeodomain-like domain